MTIPTHYGPNDFLSMPATSHRNAYDSIPIEVIQSWLQGEYLVGVTQSTGYRFVGWSLLLRGFYVYENKVANGEGSDDVSHWGCCYIDIKDGELYLAGVRLFTNESYWGEGAYACPIYWNSVFSRFVERNSETHLYAAYTAFTGAKARPSMDMFLAEIGIKQSIGENALEFSKNPELFLPLVDFLADKSRFDRELQETEVEPLQRGETPITALLDISLLVHDPRSTQPVVYTATLYPLTANAAPERSISKFTFTRLRVTNV